MKSILRFGSVALVGLLLLMLAALPLATSVIERWSVRDVELRSQLIYQSIRDDLVEQLAGSSPERLSDLFDRITTDERVMALGYCASNGRLQIASRSMPTSFACPPNLSADEATFTRQPANRPRVLVAAFPVAVRGDVGHLAIISHLGFVEARVAEVRRSLLAALALTALLGAVCAAFIAFFVLRGWMMAIRGAVEDLRAGRPVEAAGTQPPLAFGSNIREVIQELNASRVSIDAAQTEWTPDTLRLLLGSELPGSEIMVVSNREPYIHHRDKDGKIQLQIPASGLVAALEPVMRACGGTWVAHGSGDADRETVDGKDRVAVPPADPSYTLRRVWLSDEEQEGYYYGFANEGLWPLCHIAFVRPIFREADWRQYQAVNQKFADAIVAEAKQPDPIILVQDYHFALLPRMVREKLPEATIITFWHIPWPNSETFGICPYREEIIEGLLGSSIVGFHTQFHCNNFIETIDRLIESRIDRERASVTLAGNETLVRPYPISIDWPPAGMDGQRPVAECRQAVRERLGLNPDCRIGVGIERFDYTKGIIDRMRAVDSFLTEHPEWRGRFTFVQAAAPTRSKLPSYRMLQDEAFAVAEEINARHAGDGCQPIQLLARHHEPGEVFELFRAADVCVVSSLHDGMNLVAKEFVAARDDEQGVLVLSAFAGASRELAEALIVNPYDNHSTGEAIARAITMPAAEQRERMRMMRDQVRSRNVYRWAGQMLIDAARLRKRLRLRHVMARTRTAETAKPVQRSPIDA